MKKVYVLTRPDADYDEHDGATILADSEEEARAIARDKYYGWDASGVSCEEVNLDGDSGVISDSFRAG